MRISLPLLAALFATVGASAVAAQDRGVAFGGVSAGEGYSAYAGALTALGEGGRLGRGLAVRGSINTGEYRYQGGPGEIEARYVGGEAALVQQWSGDWGWSNLAAGPRFTNTDLSPVDPGNDRQGDRWDFAVGADGQRAFGDWRLGWYGSYGIGDEAYQGQLRLGRVLDPASQLTVGAEIGAQGDPSYDTRSAGLFVRRAFTPRWAGEVSAGVRDREGDDDGGYLSVGLSRVF